MRICVAQMQPVKGDVERNIDRHLTLMELAIAARADTVIFPELSVTGYEPELASALATDQDDHRFNVFQAVSDAYQLTIGVGMPLRSELGLRIGMLIFAPNQPRQTYAKQHLHPDEYPYFVPGDQPGLIPGKANKMSLAICYEVSIPEHAEMAYKSGTDIYVASVAKSAAGVEKAGKNLSDIANTYGMTVLMANSIGPSDNFVGGGSSAIWNKKGLLIGQLDDINEGILLIDTETPELISQYAK